MGSSTARGKEAFTSSPPARRVRRCLLTPPGWSCRSGPTPSPSRTATSPASAALPDGSLLLTAHATDVLANSGTASFSFTVDNSGPAVAVAAPAFGAFYSSAIPIDVTAVDPSGIASLSVPALPSFNDLDSAEGH